ncbi:MAG: MBL fold metallo-hydrolase [Bryobacterales bacterium]
MRRAPLLLAFTALLAIGLRSAPDEPEPARWRLIADGVWFRLGDALDGQSNNVIIEMQDGLLVVDANVPNGASQLLAEAAKVSAKPVTRVFDTHHHGDHLYGNSVFTRAGAHLRLPPDRRRDEPRRARAVAREHPAAL